MHVHYCYSTALQSGSEYAENRILLSITYGPRLCRLTVYNKGIIHVQKFCTFDCYNILPALKQEVQFDAHGFHLALVLRLMSNMLMHSKLHVALSRFGVQQLSSLMSKADVALSRSGVQQLY